MADDETEIVVTLDLDYRPEAAVSGELLVATEDTAWLLFNAVGLQPDGLYHYAGTAAVEFPRCQITRFGYPNDEGRPVHPMYSRIHEGYGIFEVLNSSWVASELGPQAVQRNRHFIVSFHDSTFECIAADIRLEVTQEPFQAVLHRIMERVLVVD